MYISYFNADIIILPEDTDKSSAWRDDTSCSEECSDLAKYEKCLMCRQYSFDDLVLSYNGTFDRTFKIAQHGPEYIIRPKLGQIKYIAEEGTLSLSFKTSFSYVLTFVDPKYQLLSVHPTAIPKTIVKISEESGITLIYLKVYILKLELKLLFD